jgi:hypothetical protein
MKQGVCHKERLSGGLVALYYPNNYIYLTIHTPHPGGLIPLNSAQFVNFSDTWKHVR